MYKQVIVVRTDLNMGKGKIASQACHASIEAFIKAQKECPEVVEKWLREGQKKVVVKVNSEKELMEVFREACLEGLPCSLIRDAGRTQLTPGTCTAVAIGPEREERIDKITGRLKLL
ncbi:aminoacyl-tRNA hydrolase [Methanofervidicoccus sp. A16]|uniref:peptidyl-tRNA hydrolase Pth2 n=1 Tax=Methanofervidicoccus sp. A16 TaxID=2607662 RepID=UPI001189996D|nr:peptidyl-tRNA hydrolase Pth2 [Methanofervidicoccus sp. A16]AXI25007.1 aminoacyl-tRNA hydrolase [Methanofervidicoccus sp. A16]MBW9220434.1 peptidyl-tRNA hydrolase Pth2 [Methanothermococcus sp. SCGC AD-155-N22]